MISPMSNQSDMDPKLSPKVAPTPEFDPRMIETIDFSDPNELAKLLDSADDENADEPKDPSSGPC